jgi:hypothetical protein
MAADVMKRQQPLVLELIFELTRSRSKKLANSCAEATRLLMLTGNNNLYQAGAA